MTLKILKSQVYSFSIQIPVCSNAMELKCVKNIPFHMEKAKKGDCLQLCSGLILKGFSKTAAPKNLEKLLNKEWNEYKKYK